MSENETATPSRERLVRAIQPGPELRADGDGRTLFGHFAVFNRWTEIDSWFEGHFLERIAPGAFAKTIRENVERIQVLFQHGKDPMVGEKPIADISELREDETGAYYEARLFKGLPELVEEGLKARRYGASFRFEVIREDKDERPERSDFNPDALPERTIKEARLFEFGPVTFPAYITATSGVRSLTDHFLFDQIARDPQRARDLLALSIDLSPDGDDAPAETDAGTTTSDEARRESRDYLKTEEVPSWQL